MSSLSKAPPKLLRVGAVVGALVALVYVLHVSVVAPFFLADTGLVACGETLAKESHSPGNKYVAAVFVGSCGATTGFITHVNLRTMPEEFVADQNGMFTTGTIFSAPGQPDIGLSWEGDHKLIVEHAPRQATKAEADWQNVSIVYKR